MIPDQAKVLIAALSVATLYACASPTPRLDSSFGHAVNTAKMQQMINPDASANKDPVSGLGGVPARETIERYHDSFKAPPPTFEIIFGGTGGGR
ncbi:MAG: hypothetical protein A3I01_16450 [Betaproteobacteria bacterium RIFCSPLOWO2_02_FULL_65_24]|nr:MAG: hypothetical protein A3I01_16450 [Betaproteobacteria bacterium RIFCSPLOWO2_02_FULL_65_24]